MFTFTLFFFHRYDLKFLVSDRIQKQVDIPSEMAVDVRSITQGQIVASVPLTLAVTPEHLISKDQVGMS